MTYSAPSEWRLADEIASVNFLLANSEIVSAIQRTRESEEALTRKLRYEFLTSGLKLNEQRSPEVFQILSYLKQRFLISEGFEIYVTSTNIAGASVLRLSDDRYIIHISKLLFEILELDELTFVIAHELAHVAFQHFQLKQIDSEKLPSRLARTLHQTIRYGEVSADLAAASVTKDPTSGRRALAKVASGGSHGLIDLSHDADQIQVDELHKVLEEDSSLFEVTCSHPASVLRMLILGMFERHIAKNSESNHPFEILQDQVNQLLELSFPKPSDQEEWLTILGAFWVAFADDDINFKERREVAKLCSEGEFKELYGLCIEQDSPSVFLAQQFVESLESLDLSKSRKALLLEKIVLIAKADGEVSDLERMVLAEVCAELCLDSAFLDRLVNTR